MVTRKCTDVFRGFFFWFGGRVEGGSMWEDLSMGEETFNEGGTVFSSII